MKCCLEHGADGAAEWFDTAAARNWGLTAIDARGLRGSGSVLRRHPIPPPFTAAIYVRLYAAGNT